MRPGAAVVDGGTVFAAVLPAAVAFVTGEADAFAPTAERSLLLGAAGGELVVGERPTALGMELARAAGRPVGGLARAAAGGVDVGGFLMEAIDCLRATGAVTVGLAEGVALAAVVLPGAGSAFAAAALDLAAERR